MDFTTWISCGLGALILLAIMTLITSSPTRKPAPVEIALIVFLVFLGGPAALAATGFITVLLLIAAFLRLISRFDHD